MQIVDKWGPATIATLVIFAIVAIIGGVVVIVGNMTFEDYLDSLVKLAVGIGILGVGRGVMSGLKKQGSQEES
jgi:hypothetical protein